jgi:hypothetical protein
MIHLFSSIVKENHKKMTMLDLRAKKSGQNITKDPEQDEILLEKEINSKEKELAKSAVTVIVFSAMAIEAYTYDYASRHLGDNFVKDHLDKLDTLSKWVIIPELITGREMPRHENWHELLARMIKTRNLIIHHKSSDPSAVRDTGKYLKKMSDESDLIYETARQSVTLLSMLADKIIEMDPEETPWVKSYLA